jgi:hypothetical protein
MDYTGLTEEEIEAIAARDSLILSTEREIKAALFRIVRNLVLGAGILRKISKSELSAAQGLFATSIFSILSGNAAKASAAAMKPAVKPLINIVGGDAIIKKSFQARQIQVVEKTFQFERYGRKLSDRIWNSADMDAIKKILNDGVGKDAKLVAKQLETYIKDGAATLTKKYPEMMKRMGGRIPGNMAYESLRLARTELSTVYHDSVIEAARNNPAVIGVRWRLANTHPERDVCDDYAHHDEGLGIGVFPVDAVPDVPHPNCLCYQVAVTRRMIDREEILKVDAA